MNCRSNQKLFAMYWELSNHDARKLLIDEHNSTCKVCANKFRIWEKTMQLVKTSKEVDDNVTGNVLISQNVMHRIYQLETWRMPIPLRSLSISMAWRKKISLIMVASFIICIALFFSSFAVETPMKLEKVSMAIFSIHAPQEHEVTVMKQSIDGETLVSAVAGVSQGFIEPLHFQPVPLHTSPSYLFLLSLFGLICSSLLLHWWIRAKSE